MYQFRRYVKLGYPQANILCGIKLSKQKKQMLEVQTQNKQRSEKCFYITTVGTLQTESRINYNNSFRHLKSVTFLISVGPWSYYYLSAIGKLFFSLCKQVLCKYRLLSVFAAITFDILSGCLKELIHRFVATTITFILQLASLTKSILIWIQFFLKVQLNIFSGHVVL